ncbi:MAG: HNH endonuclease signature motif containing protein, partial [Burkholderiales bacterium]
YANNNPYKYTDPDGRLAWFVAVPIVYGITALLHSDPANAPGPGDVTETTSPAEALSAALPPAGRIVAVIKLGIDQGKKQYREGAPFTRAQKRDILAANRERNGGELRSDKSGEVLKPSEKSQRGVTPASNEAQVDHKVPRSRGGTNDPENAQVLSRQENRTKSDKIE